MNVKEKNKDTENTATFSAKSPGDNKIINNFKNARTVEDRPKKLEQNKEQTNLPAKMQKAVNNKGENKFQGHNNSSPNEVTLKVKSETSEEGNKIEEQSRKNKDHESQKGENKTKKHLKENNGKGAGDKGKSINNDPSKNNGNVATTGVGSDEESVMSGDRRATVPHTWKVPDGGWGWVVVVSAMVISLIVDGLTYTFGIFLGELERVFQKPKSTISLASSLQVGLYLFIGPVVSVLTNRFGCRPVIIAGSLVAGFAFILSSWSPDVTILILTYGVLGGIGFGLMYLPAIVAVSVYFEERRAIATGIAVCGSGIGTFILAPLTDFLLSEYNWSWTLLILGGLILNGVVFGALVRPLELQVVGTSKDNANLSIQNLQNEASFTEKTKRVSISTNSQQSREEVPLLQGEDVTLSVTKETAKQDISPKMFFSSTPQLSTIIENDGSNKSSETFSRDNPGTSARPRSNTVGMLHLTGPTKPTTTSDSSTPRVRAHAPLGLAFISLSDAHLNKIREDTHLPLSRKDLHQSGPLAFPESDARLLKDDKVQGFHVSKRSITSLSVRDGQEDTRAKPQGVWSCLPASARETLEEMLSISILKDKRYWFVLMGNFFCMIGFYVPFVYVPDRAKQIGIGEEKAAFLLSIIGITNTVGRVCTGVFINVFNVDCLIVTSVSLALAGIVTVACPFCYTYTTLAIVSAIFGVCVAAYISLCSVLLCELLGVHNLTNAFGFVILFRGIACIMGPPIAGAIIDATGIFDPSFFIGGGMIMLGALSHALLLIPCIRRQKP